jgi:PAS domain-containing protein
MKQIFSAIFASFAVAIFASAQESTEPLPFRRDVRQMSEEQRAQLEARVNNAWNEMSLEEKVRILRLRQALHQMPPEERRFVHDRIGRFLHMSPEERQRLRQNRERWEQMTPEERERAREEFRRRRAEFEEKWRQEHPGEEPPPFPSRRIPPRKRPAPPTADTPPPSE